MDKNVKVLRGTIEKLLPYHEYIYNKESGIISARWTDNGETVNYKIKVRKNCSVIVKTITQMMYWSAILWDIIKRVLR